MKTKRMLQKLPLYLAVAAASAVAQSPLAQTSGSDATVLEEVLVTARKRNESLQEVPIAISAFTGDMIEKAGIDNIADISNRTPGFQLDMANEGEPELFMRGIGSDFESAGGNNAIGVYVDEVYLSRGVGAISDLFDLARVEVLRGPQGTLYGKNVVGGAVNFITNKPTDETDAKVLATLGTYSQADLQGFFNGQLTDNVDGRIAYSYRSRDGYANNRFTGNDVQDLDAYSLRGSLLWTPTDNVDVHLIADTYRREGTASWIESETVDPRDDPFVTKERSGDNPVDGREDIDTNGLTLKINWEMGIGTLTSVTAYRDAQFDFQQNTCGMAFDPALVTYEDGDFGPSISNPTGEGSDLPGCALFDQRVDEESDQWSQELRLASNGEGRFNWLVGGFYMEETVDRDESQPFLFDFGFWFEGTYNSFQSSETESTAVFGTVDYDITDKLNLEVGMRYSRDDRDFFVMNSGTPLNCCGAFLDEDGNPDYSIQSISVADDETWSEPTGNVSLKYNTDNGLNFYGTYSEGYKSGGWDAANADRPSAVKAYDPEFATNYEIGAKTQFWDDRVRLNVSVFFTEYDDLQTQQLVGEDPPDLVTQNAGDVEAQGVEIEFTILPFEGLTLSGSYGYLDSEIKSDLCPEGETGVECASLPENQKGNATRRSPENMFNLSAIYAWEFANGMGADARVEYSYTDEYNFNNDAGELSLNDDFDLWDASVSLYSENRAWELKAWGKNLTDETYRAGWGGFGPWAFNNYAAPRTAGVTVVWNFDQ
jgi:iron complex outermembrane receptor protein